MLKTTRLSNRAGSVVRSRSAQGLALALALVAGCLATVEAVRESFAADEAIPAAKTPEWKPLFDGKTL